MPTTDPLAILLAHDRWGTRQILETCARLTPEQFHQKFEIGPGSLHATTTHMLAAMSTWIDTLAGRETLSRIDQDGSQRTPEQLLVLHEKIAGELAAQAAAQPLDRLVQRARAGKIFSFPRSGVLVHVATHGMHHRAQCLNMLRHLGVTPLPLSSVAEWIRVEDMKQ
jgi:uncharacterized damage-inducible protein DinB